MIRVLIIIAMSMTGSTAGIKMTSNAIGHFHYGII